MPSKHLISLTEHGGEEPHPAVLADVPRVDADHLRRL